MKNLGANRRGSIGQEGIQGLGTGIYLGPKDGIWGGCFPPHPNTENFQVFLFGFGTLVKEPMAQCRLLCKGSACLKCFFILHFCYSRKGGLLFKNQLYLVNESEDWGEEV